MAEQERVCEAEGCSVSLDGRDPAARFCSDRCRARAWKANVGYGRRRRPPASTPTARRPPEPRVSYRKVFDAISRELEGEPAELGARIRVALESCLSPRAREAVSSSTE